MHYNCEYCKKSFLVNTSPNYLKDCCYNDVKVCPFCGSSRIFREDVNLFEYEIEFIKLSKNAIPFKYSRSNDACMDMYASKGVFIEPGQTKIVYTDIALVIPKGYEGRIIGRSGHSSKGILVSHGVIDEEYRGNIGVIVTNLNESNIPMTICTGDRIAQFSIHRVNRVKMKEVEKLSESNRQNNGFGSSGN